MKRPRGYESLRRCRVTLPNTSYFVTLCTYNRVHGLNFSSVASAIKTELDAIESDGVIVLRTAVLMPDHLHLFFRLTGSLSLGQIIGRLKTKTRSSLLASNLRWQGNNYEHRLRPDEYVEDVGRYIFHKP